MHIDTTAVQAVRHFEYGAVVPSVHFASTFEMDIDTVDGKYAYQRGSNPSREVTEKVIAALIGVIDTVDGKYAYQRGSNPSREVTEKVIAALEGAEYGFAFATGMAATTAAFSLLSAGDEVLFSSNVYGGTFRYVEKYFDQQGLTGTFFDDLGALTDDDFHENTRMVFVETPGNPTLRIVDIARLAELAHKHGALLVIDNTFMTGVLQRPLDLGADLVVQSGTKFLGGHSDLLAGAVTTNDPQLAEKIQLNQKVYGGVLDPFTSFRLFQSMKTLPLRLERQQQNAASLIEYLEAHPGIKRVLSAGSFSSGEREIHKRQASGIGAVFSFELADACSLNTFSIPTLNLTSDSVIPARSRASCVMPS